MLANCTSVWMLRTQEPDKPAFESAAIRQHPNFEHWRPNSCVVSMSDIRMCNGWSCVSSAWPGQKYASSTKPSFVSKMSSKPIVCHQSSDPFQFNLSSISYHTKDGPLRWPGETFVSRLLISLKMPGAHCRKRPSPSNHCWTEGWPETQGRQNSL